MSFKAKDLHYNDKQPAFLRRLRGELAGDGSGRHEQPVPRNKRLKKDDDEDDAPTYVLEETNQSMTKAEYEAMVAGKDAEKTEDATNSDSEATKDPAAIQPKDNIVEVGKATKKRKVAKVIAEEKDVEAKEPIEAEKKVVKKAKKKGKPVKLSFGDEEGA
ncbi:hypothetical protein DPSP01_000829 [Paraphaeosphaeria sporulosa]|uniref:DUF4604 domain-containing protein n=1 Tax=Paraphaeosphaeria sporulosa TaxID=1460663 RepID=A0A177CRP5_9PLEO|nr:uncharacterized protein CC84DRAFT_1081214 [Paraphaeosphaeria sporulosa]OAG09447.1 hypothetical protein CC84DRAFT_1081214 [Paraphaeosphaeria sporulosa]